MSKSKLIESRVRFCIKWIKLLNSIVLLGTFKLIITIFMNIYPNYLQKSQQFSTNVAFGIIWWLLRNTIELTNRIPRAFKIFSPKCAPNPYSWVNRPKVVKCWSAGKIRIKTRTNVRRQLGRSPILRLLRQKRSGNSGEKEVKICSQRVWVIAWRVWAL